MRREDGVAAIFLEDFRGDFVVSHLEIFLRRKQDGVLRCLFWGGVYYSLTAR